LEGRSAIREAGMHSKRKVRQYLRGPGLPALVALAASLFLVAACSGSGSGDDGGSEVTLPPITASFTPSGTAAVADLVRLTGDAVADMVTVHVTLRGQTTSNDLYAFAFEMLLSDPTVASYVSGSAQLGQALQFGAGQQGTVLVSQSGNRITVGVTKLGGGSGNGVGATDEVVVSLDFQVVRRNAPTTLAVDTTPPASPSALDSHGAAIPSVSFDTSAATLMGS
jgi:hypothetical protein